MLIHRDNPEERGRAASQLVIGTVDEAQSGQQMALIAWKCWEGGICGRLRQASLSPLSASHSTSPPLPSPPVPLASSLINGAFLSQHGLLASTVSRAEPQHATKEIIHHILTNTTIRKIFQIVYWHLENYL